MSEETKKQLTYADAGVNIDAGNEPSVDPTTQIELNISVDLTMNDQ